MKFGGYSCIDVEHLMRAAPGAGLDPNRIAMTNANHFAMRSGAKPSTGRLLMRAADVKAIDLSYGYAELYLSDAIRFPYTAVIGTAYLYQFAENTDSAPVLVDIADYRYIYARQATRSMAVLARDDYGIERIGTSNPNWNGLITLLRNPILFNWEAFSIPELTDPPAGFDFRDCPNAVESLEWVLNQTGYTLSQCIGYDPAYRFVEMGKTPAARDWKRVYDGYSQTIEANIPEYVNVRFAIVPQPLILSHEKYNIVTVATGYGVGQGTYIDILDGMPALPNLEVGGAGYTNTAAMNARAAERVANWVKMTRRNFRRNVVYDGYQVYSPVGEDCTAVVYSDRGSGPQTEIVSESTAALDVPAIRTPNYLNFDGPGYVSVGGTSGTGSTSTWNDAATITIVNDGTYEVSMQGAVYFDLAGTGNVTLKARLYCVDTATALTEWIVGYANAAAGVNYYHFAVRWANILTSSYGRNYKVQCKRFDSGSPTVNFCFVDSTQTTAKTERSYRVIN